MNLTEQEKKGGKKKRKNNKDGKLPNTFFQLAKKKSEE